MTDLAELLTGPTARQALACRDIWRRAGSGLVTSSRWRSPPSGSASSPVISAASR